MQNNYITDPHDAPAAVLEQLGGIKHVVLDMDGTIYKGSTVFPYTIGFFEQLRRLGISHSLLTNNPSKSTADYLRHLGSMGILAVREQIYTSAQATIDYLRSHYPDARKLFMLGTPSMVGEFEKEGFVAAEDSPDDEPDALVVAFDMTLTYPRLCRAAWWASRGKPYIATNPDRVCPTDKPTILVDCGSICAAIETATDRRPDATLGKPMAGMLEGILASKGLRRTEIAMVGDRIYTDIMTAHNAQVLGVLVLSGEATLEDAARADPAPELVVPSIETLGNLLEYARGGK